MAKKNYSIMVDAQFNNCTDDMVLYSECLDYCQFDDSWTFKNWLDKHFPLLTWLQDDGDDFHEDDETTYCQYVAYPDEDKPESCVLATYNETPAEG